MIHAAAVVATHSRPPGPDANSSRRSFRLSPFHSVPRKSGSTGMQSCLKLLNSAGWICVSMPTRPVCRCLAATGGDRKRQSVNCEPIVYSTRGPGDLIRGPAPSPRAYYMQITTIISHELLLSSRPRPNRRTGARLSTRDGDVDFNKQIVANPPEG